MSPEHPYVSICLPVYNGERYVRESIGSILEQTYTDFELVICDNASTDRTGDICRKAVACDPRVRYFRADVNRGLAWNHNQAFKYARGRYAMWIGHDDLISRDYVRRCVEALEEDKGAVLVYTNSNYIDKDGDLIKKVEHRNGGSSNCAHERFDNLIEVRHLCDAVFGLVRTEVLKRTHLHGAFPDSDRILLAEIGLQGRFILLPDFLFSRRMHNATTGLSFALYPNARERALLFDPDRAAKMNCSTSVDAPIIPFTREFVELLFAIRRASLPWCEHFRCYKHLFQWLWTHRQSVKQEFRIEAESTLQRFLTERQIGRLKVTIKRFRARPVAAARPTVLQH